jgi:hypothetical protein
MNIITDLLDACGINSVKYYIADFPDIRKIKDHAQQNAKTCFIIKTHIIDSETEILTQQLPSIYIYTKRNLFEVTASYLRMSKNKESPFFRDAPINLQDMFLILDEQIIQFNKSKTLGNCLMLDCTEFEDIKIKSTIEHISKFIGINSNETTITHISNKRQQSATAIYTSTISKSSLTSLGHDMNTFFHKDHVISGGTNVDEYLPSDWKDSIKKRYESLINAEGNLII